MPKLSKCFSAIALVAVYAPCFSFASGLNQAHASTSALSAVWCDDFESYDTGSFPSPDWCCSGNCGGAYVDDSVSHSGTKSLHLYGVVGGCWGAVVNREIGTEPPYSIELWVYNGTEVLSGCHPYRGSLGLRKTPACNWTLPARGLMRFEDGQILLYDSLAWQYNESEWIKVRVDYLRPTDSTIHIAYWINDELLYEVDDSAKDYEVDLDYIDLVAEEGTVWFDDICISALPLDSLLIPSVSVKPCDECEIGYGVQPVMTMLTQPIKGASIPIEVPDSVEICSVSTAGCITDAWNWNIIDDKSADSGFVMVALMNSLGYTIPAGTTTVFNIFFTAPRECTTSYYIHWDTALSWDPMRSLLFSDTNNQALTAYFDPNRDSTEILGYLPGNVDDNGGVNVADLTYLVDYMFFNGPTPCVRNAADVNGDCGINIADLTYLVDYLFLSGAAPVCGCVGNGGAVPKVSTDISVSAEYEDGTTTITLNSPVALRGLQLELKGRGVTTPVSLLDDQIDLLYGERDDGMRVGLLDLQGEAIIESGTQRVIELSGEFEITEAIVSDMNHRGLAVSIGAAKEASLPTEFALRQNFPNPFNPTTEISFTLPSASQVKLEVFNVMGQKVASLVDGQLEAGEHIVPWDGSEAASGIYFYRLEAGEFVETKKMVLLK